MNKRQCCCFAVLFLAAALLGSAAPAGQKTAGPEISSLVPSIVPWEEKERASYFPENLFEYIDGAAESYLSYDFRELLVIQYATSVEGGHEATLTVEIYDMGTVLNAFGIYSAERYPDNVPAAAGDSGYAENEALNFVSGRFYVKIISFGLGEGAPAAALKFGRSIASAVREKGRTPWLFSVFPKDDRVPQSEKYIRNNFMGHAFLHDGFTVSYKLGGQQIEAFIVNASSEKEAGDMLNGFLEFNLRDKLIPEKTASGYHIRNRYGQHMYINRTGQYVCGVTRVPDGVEKEGEKLAASIHRALTAGGGPADKPRAEGKGQAKWSSPAKRGTAA